MYYLINSSKAHYSTGISTFKVRKLRCTENKKGSHTFDEIPVVMLSSPTTYLYSHLGHIESIEDEAKSIIGQLNSFKNVQSIVKKGTGFVNNL
jgi:hypothetical protein